MPLLACIQQMHHLTDEEAVNQFAYSVQWRYALNITNTADATLMSALRPSGTCCAISWPNGTFTRLSLKKSRKSIPNMFKVDVAKRRFDSVRIFSNMRHLGRLGLFVV